MKLNTSYTRQFIPEFISKPDPMNNKQIEKVMSVLLVLATTLILLGAFFKIQHWPYGNTMLWIGFLSNFILSSIEINRLRKIVKSLEKNTD